jgi:hypothetical protein
MRTLQDQFVALQEIFPGATLTALDGVHLITLPSVSLPPGWSSPATPIWFVVPNGYPYAPPDCFWADQFLRLENGQMPQNAQIGNVAPGQPNRETLWFSWHIQQAWKPGTSDLLTYVKVIRNRFEERR